MKQIKTDSKFCEKKKSGFDYSKFVEICDDQDISPLYLNTLKQRKSDVELRTLNYVDQKKEQVDSSK